MLMAASTSNSPGYEPYNPFCKLDVIDSTTLTFVDWRSGASRLAVCFSNRPVEVRRVQTIHYHSVDVARGLAFLFGIGTKLYGAFVVSRLSGSEAFVLRFWGFVESSGLV